MKLEDMKPGWLYAYGDPREKANLRICVRTKEGKNALVRPYPQPRNVTNTHAWYMWEPAGEKFEWTELFELTLP